MNDLQEALGLVDRIESRAREAEAERDRFREALERTRGIVEDASEMRCECTGYYTCNGCVGDVADRAGDALEVINEALRPQTDNKQEVE